MSEGAGRAVSPLPAAGRQEVAVWCADPGPTWARVPGEIRHAHGVETVTLDQRTGGRAWRVLGAWTLDGESALSIASDGTHIAVADAVRIEPVADVPGLSLAWQWGGMTQHIAGIVWMWGRSPDALTSERFFPGLGTSCRLEDASLSFNPPTYLAAKARSRSGQESEWSQILVWALPVEPPRDVRGWDDEGNELREIEP